MVALEVFKLFVRMMFFAFVLGGFCIGGLFVFLLIVRGFFDGEG